jgi:hypothetical protein
MTSAPVPIAEQLTFVESEIGHWRDEVEIQRQHPVCLAQLAKLESVEGDIK